MCNCNENIPLYNPCNVCNTNPCPPQEDCDCPVKDLSTDCVLYTGNDLGCSGILNNTPLTEVIEQMDEFICTKFEETNGALNLINVGDGEKIYKGVDGRGRREIKSLKGDEYVSIEDTGATLDFKINVNAITEGISETFLENIGDGIGVYKEKIDNRFLLKSIKENTLGTGEKIFELVDNADTIDILNSTITTRNLDISRNTDGSLDISTPETEGGLRMYYVNENYTGVLEDGSMVRPYKRLINALRTVIGNGTLTNPEIRDIRIVLQSNVSIGQEDFNSFTVLKNKICVNTITYTSDDPNVKRIIYFNGLENYPIDMRTVINEIGRDQNGNLNYGYEINLLNVEIITTNVFGILYMKEAENLTENSNRVLVNLSDTKLTCLYFPNEFYTELRNPNGSNITFFGNTLKGQNSIPNNTPHVYSEGYDKISGGFTIRFNNVDIKGTSQTCFKSYNSVVEGNLNVGHEGLYQNYSSDLSDNFKYLPKQDLDCVDLHNTYFVGSINDSSAYPYYTEPIVSYSDLSNKVGGCNSFIKGIKDTSISPNTISLNSYIYSANYNYLFLLDFDVNFSIDSSDLSSVNPVIGAFGQIVTYTSRKQIKAYGTTINKVINETISKIRLIASNAVINGSNYSSTPPYANDADAIASGLVPGNEYFNSTTNTLQRIPFPA